eukprot:365971-Chlamydomonas_euryale.AAC.2
MARGAEVEGGGGRGCNEGLEAKGRKREPAVRQWQGRSGREEVAGREWEAGGGRKIVVPEWACSGEMDTCCMDLCVHWSSWTQGQVSKTINNTLNDTGSNTASDTRSHMVSHAVSIDLECSGGGASIQSHACMQDIECALPAPRHRVWLLTCRACTAPLHIAGLSKVLAKELAKGARPVVMHAQIAVAAVAVLLYDGALSGRAWTCMR